MLLDLAPELLERIGAQLPSSNHAILRTVCKFFNGALHSSFFSILVLKTTRNGLSVDGVEMLKVIATGETGWSVHAKMLRIIPAKPTSQEDVQGDMPVDLLAAALASLSNIRSVLWQAHNREFWTLGRSVIIDFLNGSTTLDDLELKVSGGIDLSTLDIRNLRKFTLSHYPLEALEIRLNRVLHGTPPPPPMYHDVVRLMSQNRLISLHLEGIPEWSAVWRMLQDKTYCIRPVVITTNVVTQELFDYLTSYSSSGLTKLTLVFPDGGNANESNRLADTFFETVLPLHAESLTELSCPAAYESRFSFSTHNVHVISLLHKLTSLEMSINAGAVRHVDDSRRYVDYNGTRYPIATTGRSVKVDQEDMDRVVTLLLETTATFPALQTLTIVPAETESNRGVWCGNGRIHHTAAVQVAIDNALKVFRTNVPCSAVVYAGNSTYKLQPLGGAGEVLDISRRADGRADDLQRERVEKRLIFTIKKPPDSKSLTTIRSMDGCSTVTATPPQALQAIGIILRKYLCGGKSFCIPPAWTYHLEGGRRTRKEREGIRTAGQGWIKTSVYEAIGFSQTATI
ncbi:F-box domain-containing protein [Mycena sanguinolenta]|uniref:F-box domain-containing protein n=1 Tax=Mycena sanguinolenta TaxID=230812 RepID=A0A8H7CXI7_9AGAR|nr:F-box domain-containing protein [Mycena sanguinolenta]